MKAGRASADGRNCCEPEAIFELVEGTLGGDRRSRLLSHLEACEACRERYRREKTLSAGLCLRGGGSDAFFGREASAPGPEGRDLAREVAFSLPTRTGVSKFLWGLLAALALLLAGGALAVSGAGTLLGVVGAGSDALWSLVSGVSSVLGTVVSSLAPFLLALLVLGALADAVICAVVLYAARQGRVRGRARGGVDARGA